MQIFLSFWLLAIVVFFLAKTIESTSANGLSKANETYQDYRLPNATYPEHYEIKLFTNVHLGEKFLRGEVTIDIVVTTATNTIVLHSRQQKLLNVTAANMITGELEKLSYEYEPEREFLTLTRKYGQEFAAETRWKLTLIYNGELSKDKNGFYMFKYIDDAETVHYFAATSFESTNARQAFPCYDEPHIRATFTITVNHGPSYTAISNMPVDEAKSSVNKTVFLNTPPMPTYLLSVVVSDFVYTEGVLKGVAQRIYSRPNTKTQHKFALLSGMMIADYLTDYFNVEYVVPQIHYVAIPDFPKTEINDWGWLSTAKETLLYNETTSTIETLHSIALDMAHDLSIRLMSDYVTIKWWTYFYWKEAIALFLSFQALDHNYPDWDIKQDFHTFYQTALESDIYSFSRPLIWQVQRPSEIGNLYDSTLVFKGAAVLFMWNEALTEKVFQKGLRNFLTQNKNQAVGEQQLFNAIQRAVEEENLKTPAPISELIGSWTRQSGYPILNVTRNYDNGTFTVKQIVHYGDATPEDTKVWYVPINYAVASDPDFRDTKATHYLTNATEMIVDNIKISKGDWLILNKQSTGYYRINYDTENWDLIIKDLIENPFKIPHRNRAQLLDDAIHCSDYNHLNHSAHLKILTYLKQEDQYDVWSTAFGIIAKYWRYLRAHKKFDDYKYFVGEIVRPIYEKLGVNEIPGEHHNNKLTRQLIIDIACALGVQKCLEDTNKKLTDFLYKNVSIESNLRDKIFTNGLRQASDEVYNLVYQKLMECSDQDYRKRLILYLSYTQNKTQIKKLIYSSIDESNGLRPDERFTLLKPIYFNSVAGFFACIEFLNENWNTYSNLKKPDSNALVDDILDMAAFVVSKNQEKELLELVAQVSNSIYIPSTLEKDVQEKSAENLKWVEKRGEAIMAWFSKYRTDHDSGSIFRPTTSKTATLV